MKTTKQFSFNKARRISSNEIDRAHEAINKKLGIKRSRRGRPPKLEEKYATISIRLHPKILSWVKKKAKHLNKGYQTIINEILLKQAL